MLKRKTRRQAVILDGRLSFTGSSGDALLVLDDDSLVLTPDPFAGSDGRTLDRLAELTTHGRFPDLSYAVAGITPDDAEDEVVPVRVTIEVER